MRKLIEEVFAPLIVALAEQPHQMTAGMQAERTRSPRQAHPRFLRSPAALAIIAGMAAGDQIFPSRFPRSRPRLHMVQRQFAGVESSQAILARIAVAHQNVFARKRPRLMRNAAIFEQADHTGHTHGLPCGMDLRVGVLLRRRHAFQHQHQRPARRANIDRLVARIQDKNRSYEGVAALVPDDWQSYSLHSEIRGPRATAATATWLAPARFNTLAHRRWRWRRWSAHRRSAARADPFTFAPRDRNAPRTFNRRFEF